jgi:hypothetical protein
MPKSYFNASPARSILLLHTNGDLQVQVSVLYLVVKYIAKGAIMGNGKKGKTCTVRGTPTSARIHYPHVGPFPIDVANSRIQGPTELPSESRLPSNELCHDYGVSPPGEESNESCRTEPWLA